MVNELTRNGKKKKREKALMWMYLVCDPVMGDWGRLYVAQEIVPLYRNIMRISDVATPNQFEAE